MGTRSQPGREEGVGVHLEAEEGQLCSWAPQVSFPVVLVSWNNLVGRSRLQKTYNGRNFIWGLLTGGTSGVYWLGRSNAVMRLILAPLKDPLYHRKSLPGALSSSFQQESSSGLWKERPAQVSSLHLALVSSLFQKLCHLLHPHGHTLALCGDTVSWGRRQLRMPSQTCPGAQIT